MYDLLHSDHLRVGQESIHISFAVNELAVRVKTLLM